MPGSLVAADTAHGDPVAGLVLALALILLVAKLGGDLAARMGQPAVAGEPSGLRDFGSDLRRRLLRRFHRDGVAAARLVAGAQVQHQGADHRQEGDDRAPGERPHLFLIGHDAPSHFWR
jgi:hypothetical protein